MNSADSIYFHNYVQLKNPKSSEFQKLLYTHTQIHACICKLRDIFVYTYKGTYMCIWLKSNVQSSKVQNLLYTHMQVYVYIHLHRYMFIYTHTGTYMCTWLKSPKSSHQESRTLCIYILVHVCICIYKYIHVHMISIKTHIEEYICTHTNTYTVMYVSNLILTLKCCRLLTVQKSISGINGDVSL